MNGWRATAVNRRDLFRLMGAGAAAATWVPSLAQAHSQETLPQELVRHPAPGQREFRFSRLPQKGCDGSMRRNLACSSIGGHVHWPAWKFHGPLWFLALNGTSHRKNT